MKLTNTALILVMITSVAIGSYHPTPKPGDQDSDNYDSLGVSSEEVSGYDSPEGAQPRRHVKLRVREDDKAGESSAFSDSSSGSDSISSSSSGSFEGDEFESDESRSSDSIDSNDVSSQGDEGSDYSSSSSGSESWETKRGYRIRSRGSRGSESGGWASDSDLSSDSESSDQSYSDIESSSSETESGSYDSSDASESESSEVTAEKIAAESEVSRSSESQDSTEWSESDSESTSSDSDDYESLSKSERSESISRDPGSSEEIDSSESSQFDSGLESSESSDGSDENSESQSESESDSSMVYSSESDENAIQLEDSDSILVSRESVDEVKEFKSDAGKYEVKIPRGKRGPPKNKKSSRENSKSRSSRKQYHDDDKCIEVCGKMKNGDLEPCDCLGDKMDCNGEDFSDADICLGDSFIESLEKDGKKFTVREVDLAYNQITDLEAKFFIPEHTKTIEVLDLEHNMIDGMDVDTFEDFEKLRRLDLAYNRINKLDSLLFEGLKKLETLNLRSNDIEDLSDSPFEELSSLKTLYLSDNPIRKIHKDSFRGLNRLQILNLDNIKLVMVHEEWFTGLHNLEVLSLEHNRFQILPPFHKLSMLNTLKLSGNPIEDIPKRSFAGLTNLEKIELNFMPELEFVDDCAFCGLDALQDLEMTNNKKLTRIHAGAFGGLQHDPIELITIDLFNNSLKTLSEDLLDWEDLDSVDLSHNPWKCNADLRWLVMNTIRMDAPAVCKIPPELSGVEIAELEPFEFHESVSLSSRLGRFAGGSRNGVLIASAILISVVLMIAFVYIVVCRTRGQKIPPGMPRYAYRNLGMGASNTANENDEVILVDGDGLRKMDFGDRERMGRGDDRHVPLPEPVNL